MNKTIFILFLAFLINTKPAMSQGKTQNYAVIFAEFEGKELASFKENENYKVQNRYILFKSTTLDKLLAFLENTTPDKIKLDKEFEGKIYSVGIIDQVGVTTTEQKKKDLPRKLKEIFNVKYTIEE